ncbi:unnamed protein product [Euphydryas editha]|uniref:Uncharacterized protein n=1 Tax=Euphydryas editha TaxID=104508 RepID=A0AAU9UJZ3_EUPED|nr:unnamed protein product [Euphydryas editha]
MQVLTRKPSVKQRSPGTFCYRSRHRQILLWKYFQIKNALCSRIMRLDCHHCLWARFAGKMGLSAGGGLSLFCPGGELGQPPPAHMGIPPPYQLDSKLAAGLARTPMYPFPGGTYPYPMLSPEMSQVAASWHTPSMYPISSAASGFRSPYPTSLPITSSSLSSELYRFSPTLGGGLGLGLGPALVPPPPSKADLFTHHSR